MKNLAALLVLVVAARAHAQPVEPASSAQPAAAAQPTWLVGARIGLIGSVFDSRGASDSVAPLAHIEGGRYVTPRTALVAGAMGAVFLRDEIITLGAATLGAEWHTRSLVVGGTAGIVRRRRRSEITYAPIVEIRGGAELPAGPVLIQVIGALGVMRYEPPYRYDPPTTVVTFSLSVGIRAQRTHQK